MAQPADSSGPLRDIKQATLLASGRLVLWAAYGDGRPRDWEKRLGLFVWSDGALRRVAGWREPFTEPDGVPKTLEPADGWPDAGVPVGEDGVVLGYRTVKGWSRGFLLFDGRTFTRLWAEGDTLPGVAGARIRRLDAIRVAGRDTAVALVDVSRAPFRRALVRLTPDRAVKILAIGDLHPSDTARVIRAIEWFDVQGDHLMMIVTTRGTTGIGRRIEQQSLLRLRGGTFHEVRRADALGMLYTTEFLAPVGFLPGDGSRFVFVSVLMFYHQVTGVTTIETTEGGGGLVFLQDGDQLTQLANLGRRPDHTRGRRVHGPYDGLILFYRWTAPEMYSAEPAYLWIDERAAAVGLLVRMPQFDARLSLEGDSAATHSVPLTDVVGWLDSRTAIVRVQGHHSPARTPGATILVPGGLYLMTRRAPG
jgi:hypothetical protein